MPQRTVSTDVDNRVDVLSTQMVGYLRPHIYNAAKVTINTGSVIAGIITTAMITRPELLLWVAVTLAIVSLTGLAVSVRADSVRGVLQATTERELNEIIHGTGAYRERAPSARSAMDAAISLAPYAATNSTAHQFVKFCGELSSVVAMLVELTAAGNTVGRDHIMRIRDAVARLMMTPEFNRYAKALQNISATDLKRFIANDELFAPLLETTTSNKNAGWYSAAATAVMARLDEELAKTPDALDVFETLLADTDPTYTDVSGERLVELAQAAAAVMSPVNV